MEKLRWAVLIILAFLFSMLWMKWQEKYDLPVAAPVVTTVGQSPTSAMQAPLSAVPAASTANTVSPAVATPVAGQAITVTTDLLKLTISLTGGNIEQVQLLEYPQGLDDKTPVTLLTNQAEQLYVAQSGLVGSGIPNEQLTFKTAQTSYVLGNQNQLQVNLTWQGNNGINLVKTYTFTKGQYAIQVNYQVTNTTNHPWQGRFYGQLSRVPPTTEPTDLLSSYATFTGVALSTPDNHYEKFKFSALAEANLSQQAQGGWIAMIQHYFISAWVPDQQQNSQYYSQLNTGNIYSAGVLNPTLTVAPHSQAITGATLYVGPAIASLLKPVAPYLNLTIDYGWFWFISIAIFWVMSLIHTYVGNWGLAIILVTILIKLLFYPLSAKSYKSMARMRALQPKLQALKERCGDDRQKLGRATMELYRDEKVNPLSGCLPMLIQIPVFIALYWMLMESVELRQAPFILWIHDLSQKDPFFVLPVLMGISMFIQQKLNPPPPDPTQAKVMMFLPLIFTVMFLGFPAGLVLYWLVNNVVSISQQWYVMRKVSAAQ